MSLAQEIVAEIEPEDGWWKSDTEDTLVEVAGEMLEDMGSDAVQSCMERVVGALRAEYGE